MQQERRYIGFDIGKVVSSILIITLHLPLCESGGGINYLRLFISQYVARLGVPIFFVISGFFLGRNLNVHDERKIGGVYIKRITKLFMAWFVLYLPAIMLRGISDYYGTYSLNQTILLIMQEVLFKCPAYLWYLVALIVAAYPVAILYRKNKDALYFMAILLYILGCLGNTYLYLQPFRNFWRPYLDIFLTTRNGVFFAFPFLCLGVYLYDKEIVLSKMKLLICCVLSYSLFAVEVFLASGWFIQGEDCSMYFSMPIITVFLFLFLKDLNVNISDRFSLILRKMSTWIYCSQYFFITAVLFISSKISWLVNNELVMWMEISALSVLSFTIIHFCFPKIEKMFI